MSSALLTLLATALYLGSVICYGGAIFLGQPTRGAATGLPVYLRAGRVLLAIGILVQFAAIGMWCVTIHRSPFASHYGTLVTAAWIIALVFAVIERKMRLSAAAVMILLVACVLLFSGIMLSGGPVSQSPVLTSQIVNLHVMAILMSFALLVVASACAALYIIQDHILKGRVSGSLFKRIPPLATLDTVAYHAVAFALPLLTVGLAVGFARTYGAGLGHTPREWLADAKTIASLATWLLYIGYLAARTLAGWRGVRLQYILILGIALTLALYVIPTSTHRFA